MTQEDLSAPKAPGGPTVPAGLIAPAAAFLVFAALHFTLLFHPGLVRMDDFGYLQSVAETIIRGRPFTHDSVAPYSAAMTALGAGVYALTGSFPWATWGLQAVFTLAAFPLLFFLLRPRLGRSDAALMTLALVTQPMYWYRCSEYTSNVFALVFVLAALWANRKGSWGWFFLSAFLAFANRQNNLALMALPAWRLAAQAFPAWRPDRKLTSGFLIGFAATVLACVLLHLSMNPTLSRSGSIYGPFDPWKFLAIAKSVVIGACLGTAFLSMLALLLGDDPLAAFKRNLARPARPLALSLAFLSLPALSLLTQVPFQGFVEVHTPLLDSLDRGGLIQWALGILVPVLAWTLDWSRIRPGAPLALLAAYVLITAAIGFWYDFYLPDTGLAALFLLTSDPRGLPLRPRPARFGRIAMIGLIAAHAAWGYGYRIRADKDLLKVRAYERLEREKGLPPDRMTDAPWGYLGWKLYDTFAAREVPDAHRYFICYLLADQVIVETGLPWRPGFRRGALPAGSRVLENGVSPIGFLQLPYRVADLSPPDPYPPDWSPRAARPIHSGCFTPLEAQGYRPKPFPLDAGEWSELLTAGRRHYRQTGQSPFSGPSRHSAP